MNLTLGLGLVLAGLLTTEGLLQPRDFPNSHGPPKKHEEWRVKTNAQELAWRNMVFGFKLFQKMITSSPGQNVFFSPLSISMAFSFLCLGAQDSTLAEIKEGFSFKEMQDRDIHQGFHSLLRRMNHKTRDVKRILGNTLFIDHRLQPKQRFLREAKNVYNADTVPANFQDLEYTRRQINDYVSQKTEGRINNLIRNIDSGTVMLLANYIFFRARWLHEFDPKETKEEDFFMDQGRSVKVPMMFHAGMYDVARDEQLSCTILEMPYHGNITATFILPDKGKLNLLEDGLQPDIFAKWKRLLAKRVVDVSVPRLHISGTYDLKKILSSMGINKIFEERGDLTRISPRHSLRLGEVVHKAELKMDEKGAEGAAGSGAQTLPMETPEHITFDRSFFLMIYDTVMPSMIFLAKIVNPGGK